MGLVSLEMMALQENVKKARGQLERRCERAAEGAVAGRRRRERCCNKAQIASNLSFKEWQALQLRGDAARTFTCVLSRWRGCTDLVRCTGRQ